MSAFDKVIGYEAIKTELRQICDVIQNRRVYEELGARLPHGLLLYGKPGLGKTLIAKCFIEESGLCAYTIRRDKGGDGFISDITKTFQKAKETAPCIIFLDDMDKFANDDYVHCDAEEYVAVQSGIDEVKDSGVFVLATVNDKRRLPDSLVRSGRFDRKIEVLPPSYKDAEEIIAYYLSDKKIAESVNMDDLAKMITYHSCAELETILNEAAIYAAYNRRPSIEMNDLVKAVLRTQHNLPDSYTKTSKEYAKKTALHEAGHLVISEVLCPGVVGLAALRPADGTPRGFIHNCEDLSRKPYYILVSLAGKAAVELYYSKYCADGCRDDIKCAFTIIRNGISEEAMLGFGSLRVETRDLSYSENFNARNEAVTHAELERYMLMTRDILLKNRVFLEKTAEALLEKGTLLHSDIKAIRDSVTIVEVDV